MRNQRDAKLERIIMGVEPNDEELRRREKKLV